MAQAARKEIKRPRHTHGSFGQKRGDNDVMTDLDTRDHDIDDARK